MHNLYVSSAEQFRKHRQIYQILQLIKLQGGGLKSKCLTAKGSHARRADKLLLLCGGLFVSITGECFYLPWVAHNVSRLCGEAFWLALRVRKALSRSLCCQQVGILL